MPPLRRRFDARFLLLVGVAAVVIYLTLIPILMIIYGSFRDGPPGASAAFTLKNYVQAFSNPQLYRAFSNSLIFALGAMRANVQGRSVGANGPLAPAIALVHEMTAARYVALVADAEPGPTPADPDRAEEIGRA